MESLNQNSKKKIIFFFLRKDSLRDLWDNVKCMNICIIGIPEGGEREGKKCIWWNYGWKLLEPEERDRYPSRGNTKRVSNKMNPKRPKIRHTVFNNKMAKLKIKREI